MNGQQEADYPGGQHVVMLVNNPCVNDSRVIKSAEAVAKTGRRVTVVCRQMGDLPVEEERAGVHYLRIKPIPHDWHSLWQRLPLVGKHVNPRASMAGKEKGEALPPKKTRWKSASTLLRSNDKAIQGPIRFVVPKAKATKRFVVLSARAVKRFVILRSKAAKRFVVLKARAAKRFVSLKARAAKRFVFLKARAAMRFVVSRARAAKRFVLLSTKRLLRSIYLLFETDEFGTAAEPHLRRLAPDVIHAHDLTTLPLGGRVASAVGARLVYDSHELEMHRNATYTRFVNLRRRQCESKYIKKADRVITVSESIADHLHEDYTIPRPHVIMNAPLFDKTAVPKRDVRNDLGFGEEVPLAVYVGSVTINRGIEQIVRALVHAPEMHFATVGPRRPATEEEAAALAVEIGVRDRLHFIDPVMPEEVVGYIRTADVSVLPIQNVCLSYYYCMPNKLLESVFAGVPVAVANLLEMRRFVESYGCGVVMDETDPADIARAISRVVTDRDSYILSPESREKIAENYGWPSQAYRLCTLYDSLIPPSSVAAPAIGAAQ